jgi:hypothetical protein
MLDWRELRPDKEHPWEKLCDSLHGTGVPNLDEALIKLKLQPVASALRAVLDPALLHALADLSELQDVITERDAHVLKSSPAQKKRQEFYETICDRACVFFHQAYRFAGTPEKDLPELDEPLESEKMAISLRSHLRHAMRIPQMEDGLFPEHGAMLPAEARRVLPSRSPRIDSTAVWAPVLGWLLLQVLAEWIESRAVPGDAPPSAEVVNRRAIALFDQLRLRSAFGESFAFVGVEGEDAWRAAGRIRVAFLPTGADLQSVDQDETSAWWSDADVRWLTGLHKAKGGWYFNKESYEQMVWWSALPELLKVETDPTAEKAKLRKLAKKIEAESAAAKDAKYRLAEPVQNLRIGRSTYETTAGAATGSGSASEQIGAKETLAPEIATAEGEVLILGGVLPDGTNE